MDGLSVEILTSHVFPVKFQSFLRVNKENGKQRYTKRCTKFRLTSGLTAMSYSYSLY
jgi:hypothetical protein